MTTRVTDNGAVSEAFAVTNGGKQGRVPAPSPSTMIMDVGEYASSTGRSTNSSISGRCIFSHVHPLFPSMSCSSSTTARSRHFSRGHERSMNLFAATCDNFGLVINTEKMVVNHPNSPIVEYNAPTIYLKDAHPQDVDNFTYLVSTPSRNTKIKNEIARRISKASPVFKTVSNRQDLHLGTKPKAYTPVILPTQSNKAETRTVHK
ncbi:hypothetical protein SprV_0401396100 [Sparganum proliferum]